MLGKITKRLLGLGAASLFILTLILPAATVRAQSTGAGQGLELSPPLVEISTDPGKTVTFQIRVRNITKGELIAAPQVNDFVAQGEEGQPKLLLNPTNNEPDPYSIKGWIGPLSNLDLVPQEIKTETVTLNVPQNASPGGHYGVVRFTGAPPGVSGTGVSLSASVGTLVLIRVSGNIVEKASFADFYASHNGAKGSFFQNGPITFVERIKNDGNVHFKPIGTIRVTNTFGHEVGVLSINTQGGNVLPASIRRFEETLNKKNLFGHYKAEANVQYDGHNLSQNIGFWVLPYKVILIALGIIIILFVIIRSLLRGYVRRAMNQSEAGTAPKPKKKK